jgi:hypothetical protein
MRGRLNLHFIRTVDPTLNYITANSGGRRGGAYAAFGGAPAVDNLAAPSPVGGLPRHHRRWRELGMVDLRGGSLDCSPAGVQFLRLREAKRRRSGWGLAPIRLADHHIWGHFAVLGYGLDPFLRPDHRCGIWSGPKNGRSPHISPK